MEMKNDISTLVVYKMPQCFKLSVIKWNIYIKCINMKRMSLPKNVYLPHGPTAGYLPKINKNIWWHETCTWMFIVVLFVTANKVSNPNSHQQMNG